MQDWQLAIETSTKKQQLRFRLSTSNGAYAAFSGTNGDIQLEEWYHVGAVYDGTDIKMYINGAKGLFLFCLYCFLFIYI